MKKIKDLANGTKKNKVDNLIVRIQSSGSGRSSRNMDLI